MHELDVATIVPRSGASRRTDVDLDGGPLPADGHPGQTPMLEALLPVGALSAQSRSELTLEMVTEDERDYM